MGLLDLLPTSNLGLDGVTPPRIPGASPTSTIHYNSSINNNPILPPGAPAPSELDLNGVTPEKYLDNPPG
jgi:hypothetical protein